MEELSSPPWGNGVPVVGGHPPHGDAGRSQTHTHITGGPDGHPQQTPTEASLGSLKNAFLANSFAMNELTFSTWEGVTPGFVRAALAHAAICVLG